MKCVPTSVAFALFALLCALLAKATADLPSCATVKCAEACLDNPTRCARKCNAIKRCPLGMICRHGYCECPDDLIVGDDGTCQPYDKCISVQCLEGSRCKDGKCEIVKTTTPSTTTVINNCTYVHCPTDYICLNGICQPIFTHPTFTSSEPTTIDKCIYVKCTAETVCVDGLCVPISTGTPIDKCIYVKCNAQTVCVDGICVPISTPTPTLC